jgi:diguanylate cyclase (GGDEF)-like protein
MSDPSPPSPHPQTLRLRRVLTASLTYALGFAILALCSALGLLAMDRLVVIGMAFLAVNLVWLVVFRSGWNQRFADPSMTLAQVCIAASLVALIVVLGEHVHVVAVPFYSSLFVFAMLQLRPREMLAAEAFVLITYCAAVAVRAQLFGDRLDLRLEAVNVALVVLCSIWYAVAASAISNLRARLRSSLQTIEQLANRDDLTGLWNRRHMDSLLNSELQRQQRLGGRLCAGLIDLDHFKSVNDRFGHLVGDAVLKSVAQAMKAQLRSPDQLGRFGGEEFVVLLPGTSLADARICAERLLRGVSCLALLPVADARVTISIGLTESLPGESAEALLDRADRALYQAKHEGRNRIVCSPLPSSGSSAPADDQAEVEATRSAASSVSRH